MYQRYKSKMKHFHCSVKRKSYIFYSDAYWPVLRKYRGTIGYSMLEAQQRERDEADTVSAFASLSVVREDAP